MVVENKEILSHGQNPTPSLALSDLDEMLAKRGKKGKKVGVKDGIPYWQPVKGIVRWELRQHYYDSHGKRRSRVLEVRKSKPREKAQGIHTGR